MYPDPFWAEFRGGILTIEIHKNSAYNVRLNLLENSILTLEHVNVWGMDLAEGRSLRKNFTFPKDYDSTLDIHTNIALEITFEDSIGTKYSQIFHGNINDGIAARSPKEILN